MEAMAYAFNQLQGKVVSDGYHRDLLQTTKSPVFTQSDCVPTTVSITLSSTDGYLASALALGNQCLAVFNMHCLDDQAHLIKDLVNLPSTDGYNTAVDLPSLEVNLNALKILFTAHLTQSGVHVNNDTTVYGLPANATSLVSATTLATALKAAINQHIGNAGSNYNTPRLNLIPA